MSLAVKMRGESSETPEDGVTQTSQVRSLPNIPPRPPDSPLLSSSLTRTRRRELTQLILLASRQRTSITFRQFVQIEKREASSTSFVPNTNMDDTDLGWMTPAQVAGRCLAHWSSAVCLLQLYLGFGRG